MKRFLLILIFLLSHFSQIDAKPRFLNIEISGGRAFGRPISIEKLLYYSAQDKYYDFSETEFVPPGSLGKYYPRYYSHFGKISVDYGLNNYFSIYTSAGYKILYTTFPYQEMYDQYGNLIMELEYSSGEYYVQLTGIDFNIMTKARLLHHNESLNYWFALGPGFFAYKPKLKFFGPGEKDLFLLSKDAFSEDSAGILWYINLGTGMDIRLGNRWFLLFNGVFLI